MINANLTNQSKVKIVYKGRHSELTELFKQKLKLDLVKKYPNLKDIIIENKGNNDDIKFLQNLVNNIKEEISEQIDTPEFVERLICDWFDMNNINNVNVEDVVKLNKEIDKETNFKFYENKERKELNIEYIKWDNILSYGDGNEFDFTKLNGITLIKGEPQNQSGKTTFSKHIIEIFLFGSKSQRILSGTIDDVFNNNKDIDEAYIEGVFNINNKRYKIERTFSKNKSPKEKINFYLISENGELIGHESLNKDKKVDTQSFIETITFPHFTKKEGEKDMFFTDFTLIDRYSVEKIIREGDTYRTKNFRNEIGLCNIIEKEEYIKNKFKEKQKTLECVTHKPFFEKYSKDKEEYADKKETIDKDIKTLEKNIETLEKNIKTLEKDIETLEKEKKHFDIDFDKKLKEKKGTSDIITIEKTIETLEKEIEINKEEIDKKNKEISSIKETNKTLHKEIEELKNENISIDNKIKEISKKDNYTKKIFEDAYNSRNIEKTQLEKELKEHEIELKSLREKRCCSKCGQIVPNVEEKIKREEEIITKLDENKKNITKKFDNCVTILNKISKIESNEILIKEKELSIKSNILQISTNENFIQITKEVSIRQAEEKIEEEKDFIKGINNNKKAIEYNQKIDNQINVIKEQIKNIQSQLNNNNISLGEMKGLEKENEKNIEKLNEIIDKIKKSKEIYDIWDVYYKCLGKNGISKIVLNRVINNLNKELSYILRDVCDFDIEIELDDNGDLIFYKTKEGENKISITNAASGFEATISGLALRYLLMKYSKTYQPTFLVLDEINATVAPENQEKLMLLYRRMLEDYSYLMVVTHAETNEDDYDHIIKVTKTNGISSISLEK